MFLLFFEGLELVVLVDLREDTLVLKYLEGAHS